MSEKKIEINFIQKEDESGWIHLFLKYDNNKFEFWCSNVFPPFHDFINLIHHILINDLPFEIMVDQEGSSTMFSAKSVKDNEDEFILSIYEKIGDEFYLSGQFNRVNFVKEFINKLKWFIDNKFNNNNWEYDNKKIKHGANHEIVNMPIKEVDEIYHLINNAN
jgi:hypothetical protein